MPYFPDFICPLLSRARWLSNLMIVLVFYHRYKAQKHYTLLNVSLSLISAIFYLSVLLHVVFRMTCTERFSAHTRPCSTRCSSSSAPYSASSSPGERKTQTGPEIIHLMRRLFNFTINQWESRTLNCAFGTRNV